MSVAFSRFRLEDLTVGVDYGVTASATIAEVGPQFLRITDIQDDRVEWSKVPFCKATQAEEAAARLELGDIVFARTGATTGKSYLLRTCPQRAVFASYLIRVRPDPSSVEPRYLAWYFQTPEYWRQITSSASGSAQPGVNATKLKSLTVPVPSLPEQRRIADILDKADAIRRKRKEAIALTEELLRSAFLEMFGDPVTNPKGWEVKPLGDVTYLYAGNSLPNGVPFNGQMGGILLLKVGDMNSPGNEVAISSAREWTASATSAAVIAPAGAVVIPKRGGAIATNKKRVLLRAAALDPNLMAIAPGPSMDLAYLRQWFDGVDLASLSNGSAVPQLNKKDLAPLVLPVPSLEIQMKFAAVAAAARQMRAHAEAGVNHADVLFESLVHSAFSGTLSA